MIWPWFQVPRPAKENQFLDLELGKVGPWSHQEPIEKQSNYDSESLRSTCLVNNHREDFPGGPVVKNPPANAEDAGFIPGPARFHVP